MKKKSIVELESIELNKYKENLQYITENKKKKHKSNGDKREAIAIDFSPPSLSIKLYSSINNKKKV